MNTADNYQKKPRKIPKKILWAKKKGSFELCVDDTNQKQNKHNGQYKNSTHFSVI